MDKNLVDLRNALVHRRAFAKVIELDVQPPFELLKFSNPKKQRSDNQVEVTFSVLMTEEWFKEQINRARSATKTLHKPNQGPVNDSL